MVILIPLPLFGASTIYDVASLRAWVIVAIIWAFLAAFTVVLYPLYESKDALIMVCKGIVKASRFLLLCIHNFVDSFVGYLPSGIWQIRRANTSRCLD